MHTLFLRIFNNKTLIVIRNYDSVVKDSENFVEIVDNFKLSVNIHKYMHIVHNKQIDIKKTDLLQTNGYRL